MYKDNVINIINFIRGREPRAKDEKSYEEIMYNTVLEEINLNKEFGFDNTFLIQYDALVQPKYSELLKDAEDGMTEIGLWLELCKPVIEDAGLVWKSTRSWTPSVESAFLIGYTQSEREKIIDTEFNKFKSIFGHYPVVVGAWILDAYSMEYISKKYAVDAFCICREQFGTDGYTLWGGYYNGGYYPSRKNMLIPASTDKNKISVPVFRMLGIDPVDAYDDHYKYSVIKSGCRTLEPVWESGADKQWVEWYLRNLCDNENLGYSYTQTGQENSFGWHKFGEALRMQFEVISEMQKLGKLSVKKLSDTGREFKKRFPSTPSTVYSAMDYLGETDTSSIWFNSACYRANLFCDNQILSFRDINIFNENFEEPFYDGVTNESHTEYFAFPVVDGLRWGNEDRKAGLFFDKTGEIISTSRQGESLKVEVVFCDKKTAQIIFSRDCISVNGDDVFSLTLYFDAQKACEYFGTEANKIKYKKQDNEYCINVLKGNLSADKYVNIESDENGNIELYFEGGNR